MEESTEHWCIKSKCTHGSLNGSLYYGSTLLRSYNLGYEQGQKDLKQDLEEEKWRNEQKLSRDTN